jgi:hypothetical protein
MTQVIKTHAACKQKKIALAPKHQLTYDNARRKQIRNDVTRISYIGLDVFAFYFILTELAGGVTLASHVNLAPPSPNLIHSITQRVT